MKETIEFKINPKMFDQGLSKEMRRKLVKATREICKRDIAPHFHQRKSNGGWPLDVNSYVSDIFIKAFDSELPMFVKALILTEVPNLVIEYRDNKALLVKVKPKRKRSK